jgi:hypothetical protein
MPAQQEARPLKAIEAAPEKFKEISKYQKTYLQPQGIFDENKKRTRGN